MESIIPSNGYCFYLCLLYLYKSYVGEDVTELFSSGIDWLNLLAGEIHNDLDFWHYKEAQLNQATKKHRNLILTLHFEVAMKALKKKLNSTLDNLQSDIANVDGNNNYKAYLPKEHWAGTDISGMFMAERLQFPVVGFREVSQQEQFIREILIHQGLYHTSDRFVELNSVASPALRQSLQDDERRDSSTAFPYAETSVFRDQLFNIHSLKTIFATPTTAFATASSHNSPLILDHNSLLDFFDKSMSSIANSIFSCMFPVFINALSNGISDFVLEKEYDQLHEQYYVVNLITATGQQAPPPPPPPAASPPFFSSPLSSSLKEGVFLQSSSSSSPSSSSSRPSSSSKFPKLDFTSPPGASTYNPILTTPVSSELGTQGSKSMYVLDRSQVEDLLSSVCDKLSGAAFDTVEEMWNRFYKELAEKVGYSKM